MLILLYDIDVNLFYFLDNIDVNLFHLLDNIDVNLFRFNKFSFLSWTQAYLHAGR